MRYAVALLLLAGAASAQTDNRDQPLGTEPWGPEVFRARRNHLMSQMKTGVGLVLAADRVDHEGDARQDANFLYLTGLPDEAGAVLLLCRKKPRRKLFTSKRRFRSADAGPATARRCQTARWSRESASKSSAASIRWEAARSGRP